MYKNRAYKLCKRQKDMLYEVHFNMYKGLVDKNKDQVMNAIDRHYDFIDGLVEDN